MNNFRLLFGLLLTLPLAAWGCRCVEPDIKNAYLRADAVAMIHITTIVDNNDGIVRAQGTVSQWWKSALPTNVEVWTGDDCAYPLKPASTYLLYLQKDNEGHLGTYLCKGNQPAAQAKPGLKWLDKHGSK